MSRSRSVRSASSRHEGTKARRTQLFNFMPAPGFDCPIGSASPPCCNRECTSNFACEIRHRREDAARQEVALDLREPELHLVEPRRVTPPNATVSTCLAVRKNIMAALPTRPLRQDALRARGKAKRSHHKTHGR